MWASAAVFFRLGRHSTSRRKAPSGPSGFGKDSAARCTTEKLNAWTHLVGAVLALVGSVVLIVRAALGGDPWKVVSVSIYGLTLVLLYSFSTLYHSLRGRPKIILRELDHHSIYLLIAGSYTPFCLVTLRGPWGWSLFGVVWGWRRWAACRSCG